MDKLEKLISEIMKEAEADGEPVTREEAEEMAKIELSATNIKRHEQSNKKRKEPKPKERKIDPDKKHIFNLVKCLLEGCELNEEISNLKAKTETELNFEYNNAQYSWRLVKHRR